MSNHQPYFINHGKSLRFPWSLYHKPLLRSLETFLQGFDQKSDKKILVIGPGNLQELNLLVHYGFIPSVLDIDERTLESLKKKYPESIENFYHVDERFNGYPHSEKFDALYAKEVIEHITDTHAFCDKFKQTLKPGARIWMSTPNYGFFLLPLLEKTFLELIARLSGFSRRDIHPNKFNSQKLLETLQAEGFNDVKVEVTFASLALCGTATV